MNIAVDSSDGSPATGFVLNGEDYLKAKNAGEITAIVHSHPNNYPLPTDADLSECEKWGLPWHIVSPHLGEDGTWHTFYPSGYCAPLIGRAWVWGIHDCWALVRDWYCQHGLEIRDFERPLNPDDFLESPLFEESFRDAGFYEIKRAELKRGDALLMSIRSRGLNHVGVMTDDQRILHHLQGRLSCADLYGEGFQRATGKVLRHVNYDQIRTD
jgi:proteasome lid subunit RPN8/RPN11